MSSSLSIVIVNWNSGELLRECLASIAPSHAALALSLIHISEPTRPY